MKFANQGSLKRGFTSINWHVDVPCRREQFRTFSDNLGIPEEVSYVMDFFFEYFIEPRNRFQSIPEEFLLALPVGADLSNWWPRYFLSLMRDSSFSPLFHTTDPLTFSMYRDLVDLYETFDKTDARWSLLEEKAKQRAHSALIYHKTWIGPEPDAPKPKSKKEAEEIKKKAFVYIHAYDFCAAWLVVRACSFVTRYSPWWASATLPKFMQTSIAYAIQIKETPAREVLRPTTNFAPELYQRFLNSLNTEIL